jgi:hypothetical protein
MAKTSNELIQTLMSQFGALRERTRLSDEEAAFVMARLGADDPDKDGGFRVMGSQQYPLPPSPQLVPMIKDLDERGIIESYTKDAWQWALKITPVGIWALDRWYRRKLSEGYRHE